MSRDKLEKIAEYRAGRGGPEPDPNRPDNPYHLPDADMRPRAVPTVQGTIAAGGRGMQAKHTATLPNPMFWNWPVRLKDALNQWCWDNFHGGADVHTLISQFEDGELVTMLDAMNDFQLDQLAEEGVLLYEAMVDEHKRRDDPSVKPTARKRIAVEVSEALGENVPEEEARALLEAPATALRRFP